MPPMTNEEAVKMLQDLLNIAVNKGVFANTESVIACQMALNTLKKSEPLKQIE